MGGQVRLGNKILLDNKILLGNEALLSSKDITLRKRGSDGEHEGKRRSFR